MSTLLEHLTHMASDYYGFHMLGHKTEADMLEGRYTCRIDITEIDGLTICTDAEGILKKIPGTQGQRRTMQTRPTFGQRKQWFESWRNSGSDQGR